MPARKKSSMNFMGVKIPDAACKNAALHSEIERTENTGSFPSFIHKQKHYRTRYFVSYTPDVENTVHKFLQNKLPIQKYFV